MARPCRVFLNSRDVQFCVTRKHKYFSENIFKLLNEVHTHNEIRSKTRNRRETTSVIRNRTCEMDEVAIAEKPHQQKKIGTADVARHLTKYHVMKITMHIGIGVNMQFFPSCFCIDSLTRSCVVGQVSDDLGLWLICRSHFAEHNIQD